MCLLLYQWENRLIGQLLDIKLGIYPAKLNLTRQIYYTLSMGKSMNLQKKIPYHNMHWENRYYHCKLS